MKQRMAAMAAAVALFCGLLVGTGREAQGGHPFGTEDAGTQGKGNVEMELNLDRQHANDGSRTTALGNSFTMGLAENLDLAIGYAYEFTKAVDGVKSRGMAPVEATLKRAVIEGKDRIPTVGLKAGFALPTAEDGQVAGLATLIAEWDLDPVTVFANAGADIGTHLAGNAERTTSVLASLAGSWEVRKEWYLLSELLFEKQTSPSAPSVFEGLIGAKKEFTETLSVNAGIRWGLSDDSPHVTYLVGLTLGFQGDRSPKSVGEGSGGR